MDIFVFDTKRDDDLLKKNDSVNKIKNIFTGNDKDTKTVVIEPEDDEEDVDYGGLPPPSKDISHIINKALSREKIGKKDKNTKEYEEFIETMGWTKESLNSNQKMSRVQNFQLNDHEKKLFTTNIEKELKTNVLKGVEKKHSIECLTDKKLAEQRRKERSKTKGKEWFNMPATEITEELENDLKILQMRSVLDPKHFYKKNDLKVLPKYFQVGTVQHSPLDYHNEKGIRKNKKKTIVDELMADAEFQRFNKRKYQEVIEKRHKTGYHKANMKMKKLKKKRK